MADVLITILFIYFYIFLPEDGIKSSNLLHSVHSLQADSPTSQQPQQDRER